VATLEAGGAKAAKAPATVRLWTPPLPLPPPADGEERAVALPPAGGKPAHAVRVWTPPDAPASDAPPTTAVAGADAGAPPRLSDVLGAGLKAAIDVGVDPLVAAAKAAWGDGEGARLLGAPPPAGAAVVAAPAPAAPPATVDVRGRGRTGGGRAAAAAAAADAAADALPPAGVDALAAALHGALTARGTEYGAATAIAVAVHALLAGTWVGRAVAWVATRHAEKERKKAARRQRRRGWWEAGATERGKGGCGCRGHPRVPAGAGWGGC